MNEPQWEFWTTENTGWSNGLIWFPSNARFESFAAAMESAKNRKKAMNDPKILWRVVHQRVWSDDQEEITTRKFTQVTDNP